MLKNAFITLTLLLHLIVLTACFDDGFTTFTTATTDDSRYQVNVRVGESFGFGSVTIEVSIDDLQRDEQTQLHTFTLANDGANLTDSNLELTLSSSAVATLCARGQEQANTLYIYQLNGRSEPQVVDGC